MLIVSISLSLMLFYVLTLHMYNVVAVQGEHFAFKLTIRVVQEGITCAIVCGKQVFFTATVQYVSCCSHMWVELV